MSQLFSEVLKELGDGLEASIKEAKERFAFLRALCEELETRANAVVLNDGEGSPTQAVADGEKVIGTLPEPLRRLSAVRMQMDAEVKADRERARQEVLQDLLGRSMCDLTPDKIDGVLNEITQKYSDHGKKQQRADLAGDLFWRLVAKAFPVNEDDDDVAGTAIREKWQVVVMPEKEKVSGLVIGPPIIVPAGGAIAKALDRLFDRN